MSAQKPAVADSANGEPVRSAQREQWVEAALAHVDRDAVRDLIAELASIPSPTGDERRVAEHLVARMSGAGLEAAYQPIDDRQGNALGWVPGDGTGADLLLYAPIDTHLDGDDDLPWIGEGDRPDLRPEAHVDGQVVVGLGAENPKAYVAAAVVAGEAIKRAGIPLRGALRLGFGAGGMPTAGRPDARRHDLGQGIGCSYMLQQGFRGDFAIIVKPGWAVSYEEVGLAWFRVVTHGGMNYTGIRHLRPYRNPIVAMGAVIAGLERWFPEYTAANSSGLVAPQGSIGAIRGGWSHKPAFVPAVCELYVDLRVSPRVDVADVRRQFEAALRQIADADDSIEVTSEPILAIPGSHTPPESWIVRSTIGAWEATTGLDYTPPKNQSGATDANILRARGVPTARIGIPPVAGLPFSDRFSMGVVDAAAPEQLSRLLVRAAIDTCTRPADEVRS